jgi:hypothetical protein
MNICIYKCIREGCSPFLLYLLVYDENTKTYILPNHPTLMLDSQEEEKEQDVTTDNTEEKVMNIFKEKLFEIYPPNKYEPQEEETDLYNEELFKGFFLNETEITMVYDATRINIPLSSNKYCWVSPYEIFILKQMKSTPISKSVEQLFDEISESSTNKHDFYHLKHLPDNSLVKTPYILFMCKRNEITNSGYSGLSSFFGFTETNKIYETVEYSDNEKENSQSIIFPTIPHENIGTYTFFSSYPFSKKNTVKRFAVFVDIEELHPLYLEKTENDKLLTLYDIEDKDTQESETKQFSSVTFLENKNQLWCIKSPYYFIEVPDNNNFLFEYENISLDKDTVGEEGQIAEK